MNLALAVKYGTNESLFLTNLCFWIEKNKANKANYRDGHYWVYNTMDAWAELFPYFSKDQIRHLINKMKSQKILLVGVYNRIHYDRTQWYSVSGEVMELYLGGFKKESGDGPGGKKEAGEKREEGEEKREKEPAGESAAFRPEGPMDAVKVPHPLAPGGRWMWQKSHMEAGDLPDRCGESPTTIPYNKPINKPAAAAERIPEGQMPGLVENSGKAAAGFFDIKKMKTALAGISGELVFDDRFYLKAVECLKARGFDGGYLSWLYDECRKREPENLRGLYVSLFAKEDMALLYRNAEKERLKTKAPVSQTICPACGTAFSEKLECCPECELDKRDWEDPGKIERQKKFYLLPGERKDEYIKEQWAFLSRALESGMPVEETKAQWIMLEKKYRLLE
jgi:hypothetical protein